MTRADKSENNIPRVAKKEVVPSVTDTATDIHAERKDEFKEKRSQKKTAHPMNALPEKTVPKRVGSKLYGILKVTHSKSKPTGIQEKKVGRDSIFPIGT